MQSILTHLANEALYYAIVPVSMVLLLHGSCRRRSFAGFAVVAAVALLTIALQFYDRLTGLFTSAPWQAGVLHFIRSYFWFIYLGIIYVCMKLCYACTWLTDLFCFLVSYCIHELLIGTQVYLQLTKAPVLAVSLLNLVLAVVVIVAVVSVFRQKMNSRIILALQKRHPASLILLLVLALVLMDISARVVMNVNLAIPLLAQDAQLQADGLHYLDIASDSGVLANAIGNFIILFALYHMLTFSEADLNEELFSTMYSQERAQYKQFRQNVDYINAKYHDLKHILSLFQSDQSHAEHMLENITESVAFLPSEIDTGDETLDNILADRYIRCKQKKIELHLMTDGTTFEWIDKIDLYLIFCNMLDNAIEYLETVEQERVITLGIKSVRQMVFIHQENSLYQHLNTVDGIPVSTKGEAHSHGFGIKSIITTAERYGGNVAVRTENGKFALDILFQKPQETQ